MPRRAGTPVLFVTRDGIPPATVAALAEIEHYLMRGDSAVSGYEAFAIGWIIFTIDSRNRLRVIRSMRQRLPPVTKN